MVDLNNLEEIKKLDPKNVFGSTEMFADQCQQVVDMYLEKINYTDDYKNIDNMVICGMGGSAYGAHIANSLYHKTLKIPLELVSDYHLPGFVDQNSLVILTSYSGSTEEVLNCAQEAVAKNAKITGLCSGGKLGEFLKKGYPSLIFDPKFNPSGQPRLGTGYIVMGTIVLLSNLGVITSTIAKDQAKQIVEQIRNTQEETKKEAMEIAKKLHGAIPVIFAAEHLAGNAHIIRNQINETAKSFSAFSQLPELNHHLMEGLKNPEDKKLVILSLTSNKYSPVLKKRIELTKDVVGKNNVNWVEYKAKTEDTEVLNVLSFGGYLSFYLAILYGQDPSVIPWVDYFKTKLAES